MWVAWLLSVWLMKGTLGDTVLFHKTNDQDGRCIYSFSVPSRNEASCSDQGEAVTALQQETKAQLESARARLNLLENLVNQLHGSQIERSNSFSMVGLFQREMESLKKEQAQKNTQVCRLESTISNLLQDKAGLEEDKKWLEDEKNELGRRLEVALLRASPCPGEDLSGTQKIWATKR